MKIKKIAITCLFLALFATLPAYQLTADSADETKYGTINHYNALVFGNFTSYQGTIEGALAVGGDYAEFGIGDYSGFDIGASYTFYPTVQMAQYKNPNNYPSLLLNTADLNIGKKIGEANSGDTSWYGVSGGNMMFSDTLYSKYTSLSRQFNGRPNSWEVSRSDEKTSPAAALSQWFDARYQELSNASQAYLSANEASVTDHTALAAIENLTSYENKYLTDTGGTLINNILVITVHSSTSLDISALTPLKIKSDWARDYDLVVINFPDAVNVNAVGDGFRIEGFDFANMLMPPAYLNDTQKKIREETSTKVVWNFPAASRINFQQFLLYGTVLAPDASFHANGGALFGQLVTGNMIQEGGFSLHTFQPDRYDQVQQVEPDNEENWQVHLQTQLYYGQERETYLGNAVFKLYSLSGQQYIEYTTENTIQTDLYGSYILDGLPAGSYRLEAVNAPAGMTLNHSDSQKSSTYYRYDFTLPEASQQVNESAKEQNLSITRYFEPEFYRVQFRMTDYETDVPVQGSTWQIIRLEDGYYDTFLAGENVMSDSQGNLSFDQLPAGRYRMIETDPAAGYKASDEIYLTIAGDGSIQFSGQAPPLENGYYQIKAQAGELENQIVIYKYETNTFEGYETAISGARFRLLRLDEDRWTEMKSNGLEENHPHYQRIDISTDADGIYIIKNLVSGIYRLEESAIPDGYETTGDTSYEFVIAPKEEEDEEESEDEEKNSDDLLDDEDHTTDSAGDSDESIDIEASDDYYEPDESPDGESDAGEETDSIDNQQPHTETESGQAPDSPAVDTLNLAARDPKDLEGDDYLWISIENKKMETGLKLQKESALIEEPVVSAGYVLYNIDQQLKMDEGKTDSRGIVEFSGLTQGSYVLRENQQPAGYEPMEDIYFYVIYENGGLAMDLEPETMQAESQNEVSLESDADENYPFALNVKRAPLTRQLIGFKVGVGQLQQNQIVSGLREYLEGASFQLKRYSNQTDIFEAFGPVVTTQLYTNDAGDPIGAAAQIDQIPYGQYQIIEIHAPDSYETTAADNILGEFTITPEMADETDPIIYTLANQSVNETQTINLKYTDTDTKEAVQGGRFQLWRINQGAENWNAATTIDQVIANWGSLRFGRYGSGETITTDKQGIASLGNLEAGTYALLMTDPSTGYVNPFKNTTLSADTLTRELYLALTIFRIDTTEQTNALQIQWIDQYKISTGEALNSSQTTTLQITARQTLPVAVTLQNTDNQKKPLSQTEFDLYQYSEKSAQTGAKAEELYTIHAGTFKTDSEGRLTLTTQSEGSQTRLPEGKYMLKEKTVPEGYVLQKTPIYFSLETDPITRLPALCKLTETGDYHYQKTTDILGNQHKQAFDTATYTKRTLSLGTFLNSKETQLTQPEETTPPETTQTTSTDSENQTTDPTDPQNTTNTNSQSPDNDNPQNETNPNISSTKSKDHLITTILILSGLLGGTMVGISVWYLYFKKHS